MGITDKKVKLHILISVFWMGFIFIQSALPGDVSGNESNIIVRLLQGITGTDDEILSIIVRKGAHFTEYMILGIMLLFNVRDFNMIKQAGLSWLKCCIIAWGIATLYAVTDELHQALVPDRVCAFTDVCIDSAGVMAGLFLLTACRPFYKTTNS